MQGILAFLAAIPKIIDLISRVGEMWQKSKADEWLNNLEKSIDMVEAAKTPEEKKDASKALAHVIRNIRR